MSEEKEPFVSRWSRLKIEAREPQPASTPNPADLPQPVSPGAEAGDAPALPPVDSLQGLASEYRAFLHPEVDDSLRRAALRKLFADPHFNTMDGLDVYVDDYSKFEPIPEAMLKTLEHAKGLIFDQSDEQGAGENQSLPELAEPIRADATNSTESTQNESVPAQQSASAAEGSIEATLPQTPQPKS